MANLTKRDKWELLNGSFGAVFSGCSILAGVFIYFHQYETAIEKEQQLISDQRDVDYERQIWGETRAAYMRLGQTLGRMAAELDTEAGKISADVRSDFDAAYWGTLHPLVRDDEIESQLVRLRNDLRDLDKPLVPSEKIQLRINRILTLCRAHILREATH